MLIELIDYDVLKILWWVLLGVLLVGFALTDGFDMGVGALSPFVARTDDERRQVMNTIGPVWEGNQVWFILGGGAIFAAWPMVYAAAFSGFYIAMFLVLLGFIFRAVSFSFRSKRESASWRTIWDMAFFLGSAVPALLFGVAVGNVMQGVPFHLTNDLLPVYDGSFFGLLNPFALLAGLVSLLMIVLHGASWLAVKTDGPVQDRARAYGSLAGLLATALFILAGVWVFFIGIDGYIITGGSDPAGINNPIAKTVIKETGAWVANFETYPWMWVAPVAGVLGLLGATLTIRGRGEIIPLLLSGVGSSGVIATAGFAMFPFIMPSSSDPKSSLTIWDASSSHATLFIMLVCAIIFVPIVLAYTAWVFNVLRGKVNMAELLGNKESY